MDIQEILDQAKAHGIEAVTAAVEKLKRQGQQSRQEAKAACQAYFTDVEGKEAKVKRWLADLARQEAEIKAKINAMQPGLVSATVAGDSKAFDRIQNDLAGMEAQRAAVATQIQILSGALLPGDLMLYKAAEAQCDASDEVSQRCQTELEKIKAFVREQAKVWDRLSDNLRYVTFYTPGAVDADLVRVYEHFKTTAPSGSRLETARIGGISTMKNLTEEQRIREIDEIAHLFDPETVQTAKYGPAACTAQEMTYRAAVEAVQKGISPKMMEARAVVKTLLHGQD